MAFKALTASMIEQLKLEQHEDLISTSGLSPELAEHLRLKLEATVQRVLRHEQEGPGFMVIFTGDGDEHHGLCKVTKSVAVEARTAAMQQELPRSTVTCVAAIPCNKMVRIDGIVQRKLRRNWSVFASRWFDIRPSEVEKLVRKTINERDR